MEVFVQNFIEIKSLFCLRMVIVCWIGFTWKNIHRMQISFVDGFTVHAIL